MLSETYMAYISWVICLILGIPVNGYCIFYLIKVLKLNIYIKIILVIMVTHFLFGYVAIFCSLIPILFLQNQIQNSITCTILTIPLGSSGTFLQFMSALISLTRYYMAWMTSKNKIYKKSIIIIATTLTVILLYALVILNLLFSDELTIVSSCVTGSKKLALT